MNATNRKAIKILKAKMTLEERKALVKNITETDIIYIKTVFDYLFFYPCITDWSQILKRFTDEELRQEIRIK